MKQIGTVILCCFLLAACSTEEQPKQDAQQQEAAQAIPSTSSQPADTLLNGEPKRIELQHILISFAGTGTSAERSQADAQLLAIELLARAQGGEDFDALMEEYSDDPGRGVYRLRNKGVAPDRKYPREFDREQMVPAFGDVGFSLQVGEIKMSNYSKTASPYGWHIIKRLN